MNADARCPGPVRWQALLDGSLPAPEQADLNTHLEACAHCQHTLEGLAADGAAWSEAARQLGDRRGPEEPALHQVLADLEGEADATTPPGGAAADAVLSVAFLSPPDTPGHLGRLAHYDVLEVIGHGGMGVVFKAFDQRLQRTVAIKVMAPQLAASAAARQRFLREARAAAAVRHEHVVDIHAVDEANGLPYLVMEYVAGMSLQDRLDRGGLLEVSEIIALGVQTARGLAAAHARGLVHRDIKPSNLLLEVSGRVKLTDFGLARAADDGSLSQAGVVAGTPQYMAPEQAHGGAVDPRADLFSLGSVLYALATGAPPFGAASGLYALHRLVEDTPRPVRELNPLVPGWLADLIARLHAKDPARRVPTAEEVARLLERQGSVAELPRRRRTGRWVLAAAVLLAAGVALAEAAGVTQLGAAVIRLLTPDGTLVVETDDPAVSITLDDGGDLVITGAGPHEVRLRPGSYRYRATRDGRVVRSDLVTITSGGRQTVRVNREPPTDPAGGEVRRFLEKGDKVWSVAFSPDGRRVLAGGNAAAVHVWETATGRKRVRFEGHQDSVRVVAVSPDGRQVLSGGGRVKGSAEARWSLCLWDLETGRELHRADGPGEAVTALDFSSDGRQALVGRFDGTVLRWDVPDWREVSRFGDARGLWSVRFSPDERRAVTGSGWEGKGRVRLWDLENPREVRGYEASKGIWCVRFAPGGASLLAAGNDHLVQRWEVDTGKWLARFRHDEEVHSVACSPDGAYLVTGCFDNTVRLWRLDTAREVHRFTGHDRGVTSAAWSPDGRFVLSGGDDGTVRLWRVPRLDPP